jgi:hypothetical protein
MHELDSLGCKRKNKISEMFIFSYCSLLLKTRFSAFVVEKVDFISRFIYLVYLIKIYALNSNKMINLQLTIP